MGDDMQAYREVFASESAEYVQSIIDGMLKLESEPGDLEPVETVFRGAHSLKGMAAAMGYERTAELTHKMETLMDTVRRREQRVDEELADLILRAVDVVKALIEDEMSGNSAVDPSGIAGELAARVDRGGTPKTGAGTRVAPGGETGDPGAAVASAGSGRTVLVRVTLEAACVLKSVRAYMVVKRLSHMGEVIETHPSARDLEDEAFESSFEVVLDTVATSDEIVTAVSAVSEVARVEIEEQERVPVGVADPADGGLETGVDARDGDAPAARRVIPKLSETQTVRIAIGHLDNMVNLVGELVIIRSRLENLARSAGRPEMTEALEEFQRVSAELQHEVMQTRMVPVGNIFNRFPRMVRDLAHDLGKDVAFEMEGLDIELDRTVLDEVVDPLVHLLRNAVDHGLEPPDVRAASGKEQRGTVRLVAARERDQVHLIVSDDGGGMDADRIWAKAVECGLAPADARDAYSQADILHLTCAPGFSTVDEATKVSGRGVGMDVVRGKIEYLGGSLTIRSALGRGTEFVLSLPLTLAIIQALLLDAGGQTFALPLSFVSEVFDVADIDADTIDGAPVLTLRDGRVVPLYRLDVLVGAHDDHTRSPEHGEHVLLVEIGGQARGLTVTRLLGRQEVVIKPLARMIRQIRGLGGATVLGDGSVALILDPRMLFSMGDERR
jgi:two-component system chemotaxis sensor kinase CheA